jgi:hypothetical protein
LTLRYPATDLRRLTTDHRQSTSATLDPDRRRVRCVPFPIRPRLPPMARGGGADLRKCLSLLDTPYMRYRADTTHSTIPLRSLPRRRDFDRLCSRHDLECIIAKVSAAQYVPHTISPTDVLRMSATMRPYNPMTSLPSQLHCWSRSARFDDTRLDI